MLHDFGNDFTHYALQVVKTKTGWVIQANHSISNWAGSEVEGSKAQTIERANKLATNISKRKGNTVTIQVYSALGKLQSETEW